MYPGAGIALYPYPIVCTFVLPPRAVVIPYSYQYVVCGPFGVTSPVTTAVVSVGATFESVTTAGLAGCGVGVGVAVGVVAVPSAVVLVADVLTVEFWFFITRYAPPTITMSARIPMIQ